MTETRVVISYLGTSVVLIMLKTTEMKVKQLILTPAESEVFLEATSAYMDILRKRKEDVGIYMNEGAKAGLIAQSGEQYEKHGRQFYEMRNAIRDTIEKENNTLISMRNKIWEVIR